MSTDEVEEDPADCLRLSNVYRRHPPEHYCELIKRYFKAGDTNSALSVRIYSLPFFVVNVFLHWSTI